VSFRSYYLERVAVCLEALPPGMARDFWQMLATGRFPGSVDWVDDFRALGLIHVLVLSGSQVSLLQSCARAVSAALLRGQSIRVRRWGSHGAVLALLLAYSGATGWEAPIARATCLALLGIALPRWRLGLLWVLAFVLQSLACPEHLLKAGIYLSWGAFLSVRASSALGVGWGGALTCAFCQGLVCLLLGEAWPSLWTLMVMVGANRVAIPLFERVLFPAALPWVACGLGFPLMWGFTWSTWLKPIYVWGAEQLLVGIGAFRYIEGV
jgi:hypothetical protein